MKRIFLLLAVAVFVTVSAYAEHFKFMGMPLDGPVDQFEKALLQKGFKSVPDEENAPTRFYRGKFMSEKNALVSLYPTPKSNTVYMAGVTLDNITEPGETEAMFNRLASAIEKKYTVSNKDVAGERNVYYYIGKEGCIHLEISKGTLMVFYVDIANTATYGQEEEEDI